MARRGRKRSRGGSPLHLYERIRPYVLEEAPKHFRRHGWGWGRRLSREEYERDRRELARLSRSIRGAEKRGDEDQLLGAVLTATAIIGKWYSAGYRMEPPPVVREALHRVGINV